MNDVGASVLLGAALLIASCSNHSNDEGSSGVDVTRECQAFCDRALPCSDEFAEDWGFESVGECVDICTIFTNNGVVAYPDRPCEEITSAMWSCAAALPTCEDFAQFEDAAFGQTNGFLGEPCGEEIADHILMCN